MSEAKIQKDIMRYLQLRGFKVYKIADRFRAGIPDIYAARDGQSYWLEVKAPAGKTTRLQEMELRQLNDAALVVRSVEDVKAVVS
jgi:Holliday junction resolvase